MGVDAGNDVLEAEAVGCRESKDESITEAEEDAAEKEGYAESDAEAVGCAE